MTLTRDYEEGQFQPGGLAHQALIIKLGLSSQQTEHRRLAIQKAANRVDLCPKLQIGSALAA